jgi:integrase
MAYIRKLPSGSWRAEVEVSGQRETKGGFPTKTEARYWAAQVEADLRAGRLGKWPVKTLADAVKRYRAEVTPGKGSALNETKRLDAFARDFPALCAKRLTDLAPDDIAAWQRERLKTVKPSTVARERHTLGNIWTIAAKQWRWVPKESPWSDVSAPSEGQPRERLIRWQEARAILRRLGYVTGQPPHNLSGEVAYAFLLALRTAMRSGELLSLTAGAVDLASRVVTLKQHKTRRYTGRDRQIPITKQAARLFACIPGLFTVSDTSRDALFRKAVASLGIKGLTFHDSRGTALTLLARRVDVLRLQRISGHININQLAVYYRATAADIARGL